MCVYYIIICLLLRTAAVDSAVRRHMPRVAGK